MSMIHDSYIKIYTNYGRFVFAAFFLLSELAFLIPYLCGDQQSQSGIISWLNQYPRLSKLMYFNGALTTVILSLLTLKWLFSVYMQFVKFAFYSVIVLFILLAWITIIMSKTMIVDPVSQLADNQVHVQLDA